MIELRRAIHAEPEIGLHNPMTTAKAKAALAGLPLEYSEGPSTTGFVATLRGPSNGRTVLLRGDMDALPMDEDTGLDFSSTINGAMHACGHDTHVAMLVAAARALCAQRERILQQALDYNDGPCIIEAECIKLENVFPMIPAGAALEDMLTEAPKTKMEKPTGST